MHRHLLTATVSGFALATAAAADAPNVTVDIPPVHSLVAVVMEGVGTPELLVQPGASPHSYSLRPSEASALARSDLVFWMGPELEPWLEGAIEALATNATVVELLEADGTTTLEFREGVTFEAHGHGDEDHHDDHDDHGHDDEHDGHEDHDEHHDAHDDHDHDHHGHDPHAWLDPENARVWLDVIAAQLGAADPENAETYNANAAAGREALAALIDEIAAELAPVQDQRFVVFHDAYQYFEARFGMPAAGSISLGDASDPSPARIAEIRDKVAELGVTCVFAEPQFNPGLVRTVFQGTEATSGILDPLGADLEPGAGLYAELLRNMSGNLKACLD